MTDQTSLQELLAKEAIKDLVVKYCRGVDRQDLAALATLYHPDAQDDHGGFFRGSAAGFLEWLPTIFEALQTTVHMVTNHLISVNGDRAEGEVYVMAYHLMKDGQEAILGARYLDKYLCTKGRWQFSHRKAVIDWYRFQAAGHDDKSPLAPQVANTPRGASIGSDPATTFFSFLQTRA